MSEDHGGEGEPEYRAELIPEWPPELFLILTFKNPNQQPSENK